MSVLEIEQAFVKLDAVTLRQFTEWFEEYQTELWDRQIEADSKAGKLDFLFAETDRAVETGEIYPLEELIRADKATPDVTLLRVIVERTAKIDSKPQTQDWFREGRNSGMFGD